MDMRYDDKGKFYTSRVTKRAAQVLVCAQEMLISGTMHLLLENRVKDELDSEGHFIAITNAQVRERDSGRVLANDQTLILNKEHITWVVPCEDTNEPAASDFEPDPASAAD